MKIPKVEFINYRKEFKQYPIYGILPKVWKFWGGKLWEISWRGYAIQLDFRNNVFKDMMYGIDNYKKKHREKDIKQMKPSHEEIDQAAIIFCKDYCPEYQNDNTYETEIFTAGVEWTLRYIEQGINQ